MLVITVTVKMPSRKNSGRVLSFVDILQNKIREGHSRRNCHYLKRGR